MTPESITDLHAGWQLAEVPAGADAAAIAALPAGAWLAAAVPGSNHGALLAAGRIPDPYDGLNEAAVQWVGERTWAWRLAFDVDTLAPHEDLVFEGLDTCCTAWLNGEPLLASDNMFVPQRVDVRQRLRSGRNELLLRFDPVLEAARRDEALHGKRPVWNGDSARLYVRKAQYQFGWDWGPVLLCSGPWRPVRRHGYEVRIDDLAVRPQVDAGSARATVHVAARLGGRTAGTTLRVRLLDPEGRCVAQCDGSAGVVLDVPAPRLWWPVGHGAQPLYTLHTQVLAGGRCVAEDRRRIGLRTVRLLQQPVQGEPGTSFHFEVNGRELFVGGANWIPEHLLPERATPARLRERVAQAAAANMAMLRVWGGGFYEDDAFYDACDELGVMVWQDFLFACGLYPAHAAFQASVRAEASAAVRRLRHRASLVLWCGNNEDYTLAESVGAITPDGDRGFDARTIYERLLPAVCAELDPGRPYWPGSPWSPDPEGLVPSLDKTVGDRHSWEVWHQQMLPYQRYGEVQGRFVSEFGLQSHASLAVLESVLPAHERFPESRTLAWHNKAGSGTPDGHRRLAVYLADNVRVGPTLAEHVYATQFVQAEAMRVAYQDFRRRWQRPGARAVGGALVWQLNDCWPATSWAIVDCAGTAKPAWHAVRRALAPLAVALRLHAGHAVAAVMNGGAETASLRLQLRAWTLDGRRVFASLQSQRVGASTSVELELPLAAGDEPLVAELTALDDQGRELARDCAWPEPFRFHRLGGAQLLLRRDGDALRVEADRPLKGLWLEADGAPFDDNFIDLMPASPRRIAWRGAWPAHLRATALDHPGRDLVAGP